MLENLMQVPAYEKDRSFYSDWGDPREFTIGDLGMGECAGEVVSAAPFDLADAERLVFGGPLPLGNRHNSQAAAPASQGMVQDALSLVKTPLPRLRARFGTDRSECLGT